MKRVIAIGLSLLLAIGTPVISFATPLALEAEYADISALAVEETQVAGFSGTGYCRMTVPGASLIWNNLSVKQEGEAVVTIRGAATGGMERLVEVQMGDSPAQELALVSDDWTEIQTTVALPKGVASLKLTALNAGILLDWVKIDGVEIAYNSTEEQAQVERNETIDGLAALGIFEGYADGSLLPDDPITRAEFVTAVVRLMGLEPEEFPVQTGYGFSDVDQSHWAYRAVMLAVASGFVNGYGDGRFGPDDMVTFEQAVTMLLNALGYHVIAAQLGGYPDGYLSVAYQYGLVRGMRVDDPTALVRGEVAQLLSNALQMDIVEDQTFSGDGNVTIAAGKNVLTDVLHLTEDMGIVTETEVSSLYGAGTLAEGKVRIGDAVYRVGQTQAADLLGRRISFYYRDDQPGEEPLLLFVVDKTDEVLTIAADDIVQFQNGTLTYIRGERQRTVTIPLGADMIYNGTAYPDYPVSVFDMEAGSVTLLDNDGDGSFDVVSVASFETFVVDSISTSNYKIFSMYGKDTLIVDPMDNDIWFEITRDGDAAPLNTLTKWTVLCVLRDKDGTHLDIRVSAQKVTGEITELAEDEVVIGGKTYQLSNSMQKMLEQGLLSPLEAGMAGSFYLDIFGEIAACDTSRYAGMEYGYMTQVHKAGGLDSTMDVKLFDATGTWQVLTIEETVNFNDKKTDIATLSQDPLLFCDGEFLPQLVRYTANGGRLIKLSTALNQDDESQFGMSVPKQKLMFKTVGNTFLDDSGTSILMNVDSSTVIFAVPGPAAADTIDDSVANAGVPDTLTIFDEDKFAIKSSGNYRNDGKYWMKGFDMKDGVVAAAVQYTGGVGSSIDVDNQQSFTVIDRLTSALDEDGNPVKKLRGYQEGKEMSATVDSELDVSGLKAGAVIQYNEGVTNEIAAINVLWSPDQTAYTKNGKINDKFCTVYGKVTDFVGGNAVFVTTSNDPSTQDKAHSERLDIANAKVAIYDRDTGKIYPGTPADLEKENEIFMRIRYVEVRDLLIIRGEKEGE